MNRMSQWLAVALSTWFTWLIYISNTPAGSEAQADLVAWLCHIFLLVSLNSFRMEDEFLVQLRPKTHWLKAGADVNILAQVLLLTVTGHWWLAFVRGISEVIVRGKCNYAHSEMVIEQSEAHLRQNNQARAGADLHH